MVETLLGKHNDYPEQYAPEVLQPIPRALAREQWSVSAARPFHGEDVWHAYEISWLGVSGKPEVRVGRFRISADSPNLIESKSFKLYLNSFNHSVLAHQAQVIARLEKDLSQAAGATVAVELLAVDDPQLHPVTIDGVALDEIAADLRVYAPDANLLEVDVDISSSETLYSHLLRSTCPVTGQPDWGTVIVRYRGPTIEPASLLAYIVSFRCHQEFHEHCVERMFVDISSRCAPQYLSVQALYTRRGGLDINPFRSSVDEPAPLQRHLRQ